MTKEQEALAFETAMNAARHAVDGGADAKLAKEAANAVIAAAISASDMLFGTDPVAKVTGVGSIEVLDPNVPLDTLLYARP